jgi:hypothetical protein
MALGITTFNITTLSITKLNLMTVTIMTVTIMTVTIMTVTIMTVSIMTISIMTISIMPISMSIKIVRLHKTLDAMLSLGIKPAVKMLIVIIQHVVILSVIGLSVTASFKTGYN